MKEILATDYIYIGKSKIIKAGRGVFASRNIIKGEIIERCPIIKIPKYDSFGLNESNLISYFFYYGKDKERLAIALGFGSIYNHSYLPNAKFSIKQNDNVIDFVALKNIKKDDEITVNYYGSSPKKYPLWFEVK